jgi:hypothetical protein
MSGHLRPRRAVAAMLAAAALLPGAVGRAAPPEHTLTITGSRSAYAVLKVTSTVHYDLDAAKVDHFLGHYGGFAIARDFPTLWTSNDLRFPAIWGHTSVNRGVLKPGRYRVYLFADGHPVTVTVPWSGADLTLAPSAPLDAVVRDDQAVVGDTGDSRVPVTGPVTSLAIPLDGRAGANTAASVRLTALLGPTVRLRLCLVPDPASCADSRGDVTSGGTGSIGNGWGAGYSFNQWPTPTSGLYARGEVSGENAGVLTLTTLRYYP